MVVLDNSSMIHTPRYITMLTIQYHYNSTIIYTPSHQWMGNKVLSGGRGGVCTCHALLYFKTHAGPCFSASILSAVAAAVSATVIVTVTVAVTVAVTVTVAFTAATCTDATALPPVLWLPPCGRGRIPKPYTKPNRVCCRMPMCTYVYPYAKAPKL